MSQHGSHKTVTSDLVFRLLLLNMTLVIIGYAFAVITDMASVRPMSRIKYAVLLCAIVHLVFYKQGTLKVLVHYFQPIFALSTAFVLFATFTSRPIDSVAFVLTHVIPFLYVAFAVGYLMLLYPVLEVLHAFISGVNWVYFIPIASYFLFGGTLSDTSIYRPTTPGDELAFVSNHYGWSGTLFLLTGMDLLRNVQLPWWRKLMITVFGCFALYLVLVSGNRTSWLSLLLVTLIFVFKYKRLFLYQKALASLIPLGLILYLMQDPNSAVNARVEKTRVQREKGESRFIRSGKMLDYFNESPSLWLTGIGMFNLNQTKAITGSPNFHNSYLEVLFGAGVSVFALFLYLIVIRPGWYYIRYFATYYLFFLPLLIIPFFESNLTGGQFLFFPWFIMAILMGYSRTFAKIRHTVKNFAPS